MTLHGKILCILWICLAGGMVPAGEVTKVPFFKVPPEINGLLDDPCWQDTAFTPLDFSTAAGTKVDSAIVEGSGRRNAEAAETFAIGCGERGIYVAVRCRVEQTPPLVKGCEMPDGLFEFFRRNDMIELFFDFGVTGHDYYWFITNPEANQTDLFAAADPDRSWNGQWEVAVSVKDGYWNAEFFFPYAGFNRRKFEPEFGFSLARFFAGTGERSHLGEYRRPQSWPRYRIEFQEGCKYRSEFQASNFRMEDTGRKGFGRLKVDVRNESAENRRVIPEIHLMRPCLARGYQPEGNGPRNVLRLPHLELASGKTETLRLETEILPEEILIATLVLCSENGEIVFVSGDPLLKIDHRIGGEGPGLNYYTSENEIACRYFINSDGIKSPVLLLCVSGDAKTILEKRIPAASGDVSDILKAADIPYGRHILEVSLLDGSRVAASREFELNRLPPNTAGTEVKTCRFTKNILVDGKPFIAVGSSPQTEAFGEKFAINLMREMKKNNFNCIHHWGGYLKKPPAGEEMTTFEFDLEKLGRIFDAAESNGQKMILNLDPMLHKKPPFKKYDLSDAERLDGVRKIVRAIRNHPALLAYEIADEPEFFVQPEWMEEVRDAIRQEDPYHLVTINHCRGARNVLQYYSIGDIVSLDYYPIGKWPAESMAPLIDELRFIAGTKPLKFWVQGYRIFNPKAPTPEEIRGMTYMSVAHGAPHIFYFVGRPGDEMLWAMQGRCAQELQHVREALTGKNTGRAATLPSGSGIYVSQRQNGTDYYWIAVNERNHKDSATVLFPADWRSGKYSVESIFSGEVFKSALDGKGFVIELEPYGREVLKLRNVVEAGEKKVIKHE